MKTKYYIHKELRLTYSFTGEKLEEHSRYVYSPSENIESYELREGLYEQATTYYGFTRVNNYGYSTIDEAIEAISKLKGLDNEYNKR